MVRSDQQSASPRPNWVPPLLALTLVIAAWVAVAAGRERVSRLDLSGWGTDLDIPERLAIDSYRAGYYLPYILSAVLADGLALAALMWAGHRGRFRISGILVAIIWTLSSAWLDLSCLVTSFFAL